MKSGVDVISEAIQKKDDELASLRAEVKYLETEVEALNDKPAQARIAAALALHKSYEMNHEKFCDLCGEGGVSWPCPTVKVLRGEK